MSTVVLTANPAAAHLVTSTPRVVGSVGPLVLIEPDPFGPVNRIVRICRFRDGKPVSVRGALVPVTAGTVVAFHRCCVPPRRVSDSAQGDVWQQSWPDAEWGWAVDVDGQTVLYATDTEIWPPTPPRRLPWRLRCSRAARERIRRTRKGNEP